MEKPWIKLWTRWYETMSHSDLKPEALHTGPHLLVIAGKYGRREDGSAALLGADGKPLRIADLARMTRWSTAKMATVIAELRRVRTLEADGDALVFPRFSRWQEGDSTPRVQRFRKRSGNVPSPVSETRQIESREKRAEIDTPLPPAGGDESWGEVAAICDRLPWISAKGVKLLSPRQRIHDRVTQGATAAEVIRVLEGLAAAVEAGSEPVGHWNAQYVFSGHYDRLRTAYGGGAAAVAKPDESMRERLARVQAAKGAS